MIIGCPKEIKAQEGRVSLTPAGVDAFVRAGHTVYVEQNAGLKSGFTDAEYIASGAQILATAKEVYDIADMIVKRAKYEGTDDDVSVIVMRVGEV